MDSNLKLFLSVIAGTSLIFAGCSNDNEVPPVENLTVVEEGNVLPVQKIESTQPTAILGAGGSMSEQLSNTFTNIVEPNKAKHVIVACQDLDTYEDEIVAAYQRGIIITIVDPVGSKLEDWCSAKGIIYAGDPMSIDRSALISFNRKAVSMSVHKKNKGEEIGEEEVPMVIFKDWLDNILTPNLKGPDLRSRDLKKRIAPQRVSHVFPISIPASSINESGWGIPESISLNSTAELACDIYQMHSFAENTSFFGDIYIVEAQLTIHNGNLYNGKWQYSQGGKQYESRGFCLSDCNFGVSLHERIPSGLIHSGKHFCIGGPAPQSAEVSSSLQTGLEWSFDGWISGGNGLESATPIPLQYGGWTWNNLTETSSAVMDISSMNEGGDVLWTLVVPEDGNEATGDMTFRCTWIWGLPQATDDSDDRYYMQINLSPLYSWTRSLLSGKQIENKVIPADAPSACFMLIPPSRIEGQRVDL
ncbi:MAG: hypothetical protein K2K25_10025 [Muribaculaceae bacterium]|nr:hypothetical protein [Muribaculaceae bacterium]